MLAVDRDHCKLYELFAASRGTSRWSADSGAVFDLTSNALRPDGWTSADAAGLPIFPGLVRYDEVASGHIDHALRFTVSKTQNGLPAPGDARRVVEHRPEPARRWGCACGSRRASTCRRYTGQARVVLDALKKYGMIVADNGSNWFISGADDTRWNDTDLNQLKTVPGQRVRSREHRRVAAQVARTRTVQSTGALLHPSRPGAGRPGPGVGVGLPAAARARAGAAIG